MKKSSTINKTIPTAITPTSFILSQGFTPLEQEDAKVILEAFLRSSTSVTPHATLR